MLVIVGDAHEGDDRLFGDPGFFKADSSSGNLQIRDIQFFQVFDGAGVKTSFLHRAVVRKEMALAAAQKRHQRESDQPARKLS